MLSPARSSAASPRGSGPRAHPRPRRRRPPPPVRCEAPRAGAVDRGAAHPSRRDRPKGQRLEHADDAQVSAGHPNERARDLERSVRLLGAVEGDAHTLEARGRLLRVAARRKRNRARRAGQQTLADRARQHPADCAAVRRADHEQPRVVLLAKPLELPCRPVAGNDLYVRRLQAARVREPAQDRARPLAYARQLLVGGVCQREVCEDANEIDRRARRLGKQPASSNASSVRSVASTAAMIRLSASRLNRIIPPRSSHSCNPARASAGPPDGRSAASEMFPGTRSSTRGPPSHSRPRPRGPKSA